MYLLLSPVLLVVAFWFLPVCFEVHYTWRGSSLLHVRLSLFGLFVFSRDFDFQGRRIPRRGPTPRKAFHYLRRRVYWESAHLVTRVGLASPALTAVSAGALWGVNGCLIAALSAYMGLPPGLVRFKVDPVFDEEVLEVDFNASFRIRMGHLVVAYWRGKWETRGSRMGGKGNSAEGVRAKGI